MAKNQYQDFEHPFAQYVRILGKGRKSARSLTESEAYDAMSLILRGDVLEVQLGAFLSLVRIKEESGEEIAGFVRAARAAMNNDREQMHADLDWASYAGKKNHLPWYVPAALLLAQNGMRILMHGAGGHTINRLYTESVLEELGIGVAASFVDAAQRLDKTGFAYLPLSAMSPQLADIIALRNVLGLRSPVHTVARMLNPADAPHVFHGIFHPAYRNIHQVAAVLLGYDNLAVFKGEAGETERRPDAVNAVLRVRNGEMFTEEWPALLDGRQEKESELDVQVLRELWHGKLDHHYGVAAITGTVSMALHLAGRADTPAAAQTMAESFWQQRDRSAI